MHEETQHLLATGQSANSPTYAPAPFILEKGQGPYLWDSEGTQYLDFVAGIAVNALGYCHPRMVEAMKRQAERLYHVSNMFFTSEQIELMETLVERSFADRVFLCNSGAEANEAAIKLARRFQKTIAQKPHCTRIVSMKKSFHGRTYGALSATGQPKYHKGFEPMAPGFVYADFNDLDSVASLVDDECAAVIIEPIQGEGGIKPATQDFLKGVRKLCDASGALLIFDEVQAGIARTGSLFAYQGYGVTPDIISLAKGLGGGVPIGAMLSSNRIYEGFIRGSHATTFGGNPLVSAISKVVLDVIEEENLCERATEMGALLTQGLERLQHSFPVITEVRGRGLMIGAQVGSAASAIVGHARSQGLLINSAGGDTLRFVPPLIIEQAHVEEALSKLERALTALKLNP